MRELRTAAAEHSRNFSQQKPAIGLDLGDRWSWYCALDEAGDCAQNPFNERYRDFSPGTRLKYSPTPLALTCRTPIPDISAQ